MDPSALPRGEGSGGPPSEYIVEEYANKELNRRSLSAEAVLERLQPQVKGLLT
jgi:hypothetical protein